MDSLSQLALGSAIGIAVMGRHTSIWKAALTGAVCGTLPDLDAFIDHGNVVRNVTLHRAASHALLYLTLIAPLLAWIASRVFKEKQQFRRWWLAIWLALLTHPLLDVMTVYGTRLALPFTDYPYGIGSIFIIDPLYTLPLLAGVAAALALRRTTGRRWNIVGLALSTLYLGWSMAAQQHVREIARESLQTQGVQVQHLLITPTALNTVLWRVLAITPNGYAEGFYSLLDEHPHVEMETFARGETLYERWRNDENVASLARFTHGFFKMSEHDGHVVMTDLRMGQEPRYSFNFLVGQQDETSITPTKPSLVMERPDLVSGLQWLWRRALGERLPAPR